MEKLGEEVRARLVAAWGRPVRHLELLELGLRKHDVERLLRNGGLQRAHQYYVRGDLDPGLARAGCAQAAHPKSIISHFTAAELVGLRVWSNPNRQPAPDSNWLTCKPGSRRNLKRADVVLRCAGLTAADCQLHRSLWLTSDARTTVDLARELPLREAVVTIDHALSTSVSRGDLEAVLRRQRRWPGVQAARAAVALGNPRAESALESFARAVFAEAGLPVPFLQAQFWSDHGWMEERVDLWWPDFRTVGEADGLEKFEAATPAARRRLLRRSFHRDQRLADLGVELVHFGWEDVVSHPDQLIRRLQAAFTRGSRRTNPTPTWRPAPLPDTAGTNAA